MKLTTNTIIIVATCMFLFCSSFCYAQSIKLSDGSILIEKLTTNEYKNVKNEYVYKFEKDGSVWLRTPNGDNINITYSKKLADGRTTFYDAITSEYAGAYYPKTKRFLDSKENPTATLTDNNELLNINGDLIYIVDKTIPTEVIGYFVYFNY